jgi:hypothetical protein
LKRRTSVSDAFPLRAARPFQTLRAPADELARQIDEYKAEHGEISIDALRGRWAGGAGGPTSK